MNMLGAVWSKVLQLIDLAAKLVVVGVPVLYFTGWIYLETYWQKLGVSDTLLGLSTTDYLRSGAMVLMMSLVGLSPWVLLFAVICTLVMALLIATRLVFVPKLFVANRKIKAVQVTQRREERKRILPKHRQLARSLESAIDTVSAGGMALLISFLFLLGLIVAGIKPSQARAEEEAAKTLKSISNIASEEANWLIAHLEGAPGRPSLVVQCAGEACVLLTGRHMEVWPRTAITRMETCRRVGKADDGTFHCITRVAIL